MPHQIAERPFAAEERLFRRLRADWFEGDRVTSAAIDLHTSSVDRELLGTEEESLQRGTAQEVALGAIRFWQVPDTFTYEASPVRENSVLVGNFARRDGAFGRGQHGHRAS